jgi:hypothetical protein
MEVESALGEGTTVRATIPVAHVAAAAEPAARDATG